MKISNISFKGEPTNFHIIDSTVSRSGQPAREDFLWLKKQGITDVISFRTLTKAKIDFDEKAVVNSLGMEYHPIPSVTAKPELSNIQKFLQTIDFIKSQNRRVHIHCMHGKDRTGMYSFIYKMVNNIGSMESNIEEWKVLGLQIEKYPNLIEMAKDLLKKI